MILPFGGNMKARKGVYKNCEACKSEFYVPQYRKDSAKFCSVYCQNHVQHDKYVFDCLSCGKNVITSPCRRSEKKKYCSLDCREKNREDERTRRKRIKAFSLLTRGNNSSRKIRKYVFSLKDKRCEICDYDEFDFFLDIHHIDGDCTNNEINNLSILCVICHKKVEKGILNFRGKEMAHKKKEHMKEEHHKKEHHHEKHHSEMALKAKVADHKHKKK